MTHRWLGSAATRLAATAVIGAFSVLAVGQETPAPQGSNPTQADPASCQGIVGQANRLPGVLNGVTRYGSTYVLVVPQRLAAQVPNGAAPGVKDLEVGVQAGSAGADVAHALGITKVRVYGSDATLEQPLQDVKDGKLDATILWAPLAGLGIIDLAMDADVSIFSVDRPHPGPASLHGTAAPDQCSQAIREELDVSGVLPAELLVPVDVREVIHSRHVPPFDMEQARQGAQVFNATCARCHGQDAVADPHGLAPVDLRISITRFSFPAFNYIVLNGRPSKSMPPFRGTVTDDQISVIYQYLKARSKHLLQAAPVPAAQAQESNTQTEAPKQ